jgi:RHS repeat-associated protein
VQTEYTYDPFGAATTSGASTANTFGFSAREVDGTGLSFYRARYYDAVTQRFTREDPIGFLGGDVNVYAYVANAPPDWVDPLGLTQGCAANTAARQRIDAIARKYDGSEDWSFYKPKGDFPANSNKCNKFVCDVLTEAGTPLMVVPVGGGKPRCATAGELKNPAWNPDNWRQLGPNETPLPGDVAAFPIENPRPGAWGHSGIITSGGFGNMSAHATRVNGQRGQFSRGVTGIVYRRYTGGC